MEMNQLNFMDENGKMLPYEEVEKNLKKIYDAVSEESGCNCGIGVLESFIRPETQIEADKALETFSFLNRALYLTSEITHEHAIAFSDAILFWNEMDNMEEIPTEEREPIKIYINTPGGDLDATFSIIDSITLSKTPVWTITVGSGDSGGFFVGIAGHKRIGYPHSSYLFHEGSCQNGADAHKFLQNAKFYEKRLSLLKSVVLKHTKLTADEYKKHRKDDLWLTAQDALKYGIIDEIATELI